MEPSRRGILGGVAASYFHAGVGVFVTFVGMPLYLAGLGQETYGLYLATTSWVGYLIVFRMGFPQAVGNEIAASIARSQLERVASVVKTSVWIAAAAALLALGLGALLVATGVISDQLFRGSADVQRFAVPMLVLGGGGFLLALPLQQYAAALRALHRVHLEQFAAAATRLAGLAGGITVLAVGLGPIGFAASQALVAILPGGLCWLLVRQALPREVRHRARFDKAIAHGILRPGLNFVLLSLSGALIWGTDNIVISMFLGAAAVTPYAVSFRLITLAVAWIAMGLQAFAPTLMTLWASEQSARLERVQLELLRLCVAGILPLCITLGFFGCDFVRLWAGPEAVVDAHVMWTFVAILAVVAFTMGFEVFLLATSNHERYARLSILEGGINLALSLLLVNPLGAWGVALATLISHAVVSGWYVPRTVSRLLSLRWRRILREVLRPVLLPSLASFLAALSCMRFLPSQGWFTWAVSAIATFSVFLLFYGALSLNSWERQNARVLLVRLRRRAASP